MSETMRREPTVVPATDYEGPVFAPSINYRDGFFEDKAALLDYCADEGIAVPEVWAVIAYPFRLPHVDTVLEMYLDDCAEGTEDWLEGVEELQAAIEAFNAKQKPTQWEQDYSRRIDFGSPSPVARVGEAPGA